MSKTVSKRALQEIVENAQMFCDHRRGEHLKGHCNYVVITQEQITEVLEDAR